MVYSVIPMVNPMWGRSNKVVLYVVIVAVVVIVIVVVLSKFVTKHTFLINVVCYCFSMFENGQRQGYGRHEFIEDKIDRDGKTMGHYEGEFRHNQYHGKGTIVYDSIGHTYHGEFQYGTKHGYGTETHTATNVILRQGQWIRGTFVISSSSSSGAKVKTDDDNKNSNNDDEEEEDDALQKEEKVEVDANPC